MRKPSTRTSIAAVLIVAAIGGSFVAGVLVGDDSAEVESTTEALEEVEQTLEGVRSDLEGAEAQTAELEDRVADLTEERNDLRDRLKAELNIRGELPTRDVSGSSVEADYAWGEAGEAGSLLLQPTALEKQSVGGDQAKWVATVTAKNNGSSSVTVFCAGGGALMDTQGRIYDGDGVIGSGTPNCGDDLQPGLTVDGYIVEFTTPEDAEPAALALWGDVFNEENSATWAAP